jgi:predicted nucleotidyltransferase
MGPVGMRALISDHLDGRLTPAALAMALSAAILELDARGGRVAGVVRSVVHEAKEAAQGEPASNATRLRILRGLCREALDALPWVDTPPTLERVLERIAGIRGLIETAHRVELVGIAGSVARGEADAFSDVDIVARWIEEPEGLAWFGAVAESERAIADDLGRPVDLIFADDLPPAKRTAVLRHLVPLDEASHVT